MIEDVFKNVPQAPLPTATPTEMATVGGAQLQALPFQLPAIDENTPVEQLAALIDVEPMLMGIVKEAKAEALKRAKAGVRIPGQALGRSISRRKFVKDALDQLSKIRFKKEGYLETKLKSPKAVLESDEFKALSDKQKDRVKALIVKPEGAIILVPESDPRAGKTVDTREVFADVPQAVEDMTSTTVTNKTSFL